MLVICNGMYRSGSTLQYNLVSGLLKLTGKGTGDGFIAPGEAIRPELLSDPSIHALKAHHLLGDLLPRCGQDVRICYTYRDLRDVAASLYQMSLTPMEVSTLETKLGEALAVYHALKPLPGILWQRYEDLFVDPAAAIRQIDLFLGLASPAAVLKEVEMLNRIDTVYEGIQRRHRNYLRPALLKLKDLTPKPVKCLVPKRVKDLLFRSLYPDVDPLTQLHSDHISKGKGRIGAWREVLPESHRALIAEHYADWLRDNGYDP